MSQAHCLNANAPVQELLPSVVAQILLGGAWPCPAGPQETLAEQAAEQACRRKLTALAAAFAMPVAAMAAREREDACNGRTWPPRLASNQAVAPTTASYRLVTTARLRALNGHSHTHPSGSIDM